MTRPLAIFVFACVSTPVGRAMTLLFGVYWIFNLLIQCLSR